MNPEDKPSPNTVLDLLEAFRRSKVMFAAVELGVFDALSHGPMSMETLAVQISCCRDSLQTLLESCVALELLSFENGEF